MKTCNKCNIEKEDIEFDVRKLKGEVVGLVYQCRECLRITNREKMRKHRANNGHNERVRARERIRENPKKDMLKRAKARAVKKGIAFDITEEDIIWNTVCPILEIPIEIQEGGATDNSPSLDRIDTTKGYTKNNIRVISRLANIMKAHADHKQLLLFAKNIEKYLSPV